MGVSSSESHDLTAFYEMLSVSFGVLSQNTGFYPSLDRIIETTLGPLNLGPGGGSYNELISRLQRTFIECCPSVRSCCRFKPPASAEKHPSSGRFAMVSSMRYSYALSQL